jgi:hypothetical protein
MDWWMRQAQPPQSDEWIIGQNNVRTVA